MARSTAPLAPTADPPDRPGSARPDPAPRPVDDDPGRGRKSEAVTAGGIVVVVAGLLFGHSLGAADPEPGSAGPGMPALQQRIREVVRNVTPAVVRIGRGSGVIISANGMVLSQYHVVTQSFPEAKPGATVPVRLVDGTTATAEVLGADLLNDLVALKLVGKGPYPHRPLAAAAPRLGDGVLKLGHPVGGPAEDRPPVVRFGRVILQTDGRFVCDCLINGGDSGGPFFDLDGRVCGLQESPGIGTLWPTADRPAEQRAVDEMAARLNDLDTALAAPLLGRRLPTLTRGQVRAATPADRAERQADSRALAAGPALAVGQWWQGRQSRDGFRPAGRAAGVVEVLGWGGRVAALGTVVDPAGFVLTAAAPAVAGAAYGPDRLRCRLPGGRTVAADVVGVDLAYNLALLRVPAGELRPVRWADGPGLPAGTLLAAAGPGDVPPAVGVVSVSRRAVPRPTAVSPPSHPPAAPPELVGSPMPGQGFRVEHAEGSAAAAGVRPGDLLVSVGGDRARAAGDRIAVARTRQAGERVAVRLVREGRMLDLTLALPPDFLGRDPLLEDFYPPVVFESDLPLLVSEYGCPVVGLDGKAVGVAVGRIAPHACLIVPADTVVARLADLKAGKPSAALLQITAPPTASGPATR